MLAFLERPVMAYDRYPKAPGQLFASPPGKLHPAISASCQAFPMLPNNCPTVVEQLPWKPRLGPFWAIRSTFVQLLAALGHVFADVCQLWPISVNIWPILANIGHYVAQRGEFGPKLG